MRAAAARVAVGFVVLVVLGTTACSSGKAATCSPVVREALDPASSRHLLGDAPEPDYRTDPPTSGPHRLGRSVSGAQLSGLSRPDQVGLLESGYVLIQYRADLPVRQVRALRELGSDEVVVAPNPDLPSRVVATAWRTKQQCTGADLDAMRRFAEEHADVGDAHGGTGS